MSKSIIFNGSIPQNYQDYLTPFLFDPFAQDLIGRLDTSSVQHVLELASGTGCVTKKLLDHFPSDVRITATDLESGMLNIAKEQVPNANVHWDVGDMTSIPYEDGQFDLVICQFGVMLVPDKLKALSEIYRVLKKGGKLVFNVWGDIGQNQIWKIGGEVIESFLGVNPILLDPGPFSLSETSATIKLLEKAGFENVKATAVNTTGEIETAALAAKGFIEGLPVFMAISQQDPELVVRIRKALETGLIKQLTDLPLRSSLQALIFEIKK